MSAVKKLSIDTNQDTEQSSDVIDCDFDAEICHCRKVKKKLVFNLFQTGASHPQEFMQRTGAGTGCGTCRPLLHMLLDHYYCSQKKT